MTTSTVATLRTEDGLALHARLVTRADAQGTVVIAHGFSAHSDDARIRQLSDHVLAAGYDVLTYDSRGHGRSTGHCSMGSRERLDVAAAVTAAGNGGAPVLLTGISMGVIAVTSYLDSTAQARSPVIGAAIVSGPAQWILPANPMGLAMVLLTRTRPGRFVATRFLDVRIAPRWDLGPSPEEALTRVRLPVAVVHGARDRLIAPRQSERLHASAAGPSRLEIVESMGHGLDDRGLESVVRSLRWIVETGDVSRHRSC
jgi:alpha-beta hydrolase superfamily lysophospholipase